MSGPRLDAFPTPFTGANSGMTLRDYFAAQIAAGDAAADAGWGDDPSPAAFLRRAELYYGIADAMMQVRTKDRGES